MGTCVSGDIHGLRVWEAVGLAEGEGLPGGGAVGGRFVDFLEGGGGGEAEATSHNFIGGNRDRYDRRQLPSFMRIAQRCLNSGCGK